MAAIGVIVICNHGFYFSPHITVTVVYMVWIDFINMALRCFCIKIMNFTCVEIQKITFPSERFLESPHMVLPSIDSTVAGVCIWIIAWGGI